MASLKAAWETETLSHNKKIKRANVTAQRLSIFLALDSISSTAEGEGDKK